MVPFTRLKYHADFSALAKRMGFPLRQYTLYGIRPPKTNGEKRHAKTGATYLTKYVHYLNRKSNLSPYSESEYIKTYRKPIYMFTIQGSFSRFIVHCCLREQPSADFKNLPWWFEIEDCFSEAFKTYGKPFEIVLDRHVERSYSRLLSENCQILKGTTHPAYSGCLEKFFLSVQYEMRIELTEENLKDYVHFYNFERPHSALNGFTHACAWLTSSKERFETFVKNTEEESKKKLFSEVARLVESNYVKR